MKFNPEILYPKLIEKICIGLLGRSFAAALLILYYMPWIDSILLFVHSVIFSVQAVNVGDILL